MSHYHHFIEGVCENCGERKIDIDIESAERAIVEAADAHEKIARDDEHETAHRHWTYRQLLYTVDAWRKLRGER